jgi:poly(3-hydroxybutyrate) depolymerase
MSPVDHAPDPPATGNPLSSGVGTGKDAAMRRRRVAVACAVLLLGAGCGSGSETAEPEQAAVVHQEVDVDGARRSYRLFTPPSVGTDDRSLPLVLALHGSGNTAERLLD